MTAQLDASPVPDPAAPGRRAPSPRTEIIPTVRRRRPIAVVLRLVPAGVFTLLAVIGPFITPFSATQVVGPSTQAPDGTFWFGTDSAGMDVFSRSIAAIQIDLMIAASVTILATVAGVLLGVLVGMGESGGGILGLLSRGLARVLDLADAVPVIVVAMVVVAFFGATPLTLVIALSIVLTPSPARLTRTEVLRIRSEAYLDAARIGGMSESRLSIRHVLPNAAVPAVENTSVIFGIAIAVAAALGFLGVGVSPPTPEWGSMIARGTSDMISGRWWSALFPSLVLALAITSFALAGGALVERLKR